MGLRLWLTGKQHRMQKVLTSVYLRLKQLRNYSTLDMKYLGKFGSWSKSTIAYCGGSGLEAVVFTACNPLPSITPTKVKIMAESTVQREWETVFRVSKELAARFLVDIVTRLSETPHASVELRAVEDDLAVSFNTKTSALMAIALVAHRPLIESHFDTQEICVSSPELYRISGQFNDVVRRLKEE